ncbi:hypothetical protein NC652_000045 [Populus alba x Populus x berolinensis]|nr:hypothetical protein NC652_000045 [Populus alba x Populus x berolinensis]
MKRRPGKRRSLGLSSNSHHHHHHHYGHHVIKQEVTLHKNGDSRKRITVEELSFFTTLKRPSRIVAAPRKPRFSRSTSPTCLGNWKILIPNICRSLTSIQAKQKKKKKNCGSTSNAMMTVMKSLEVRQVVVALLDIK